MRYDDLGTTLNLPDAGVDVTIDVHYPTNPREFEPDSTTSWRGGRHARINQRRIHREKPEIG